MKTLFLKSNILHIRTNEGEFEVSNPEVAMYGTAGNGAVIWKPDVTDNCEWPYGVELIKQQRLKSIGAWGNLGHFYIPDSDKNEFEFRTVARLLPKEEKKEFKPAQPTPNFPKGGMSFTESAYKEFEGNCSKCGHPLNPATAGYQCTNINCPSVESSEPQEKSRTCYDMCGNADCLRFGCEMDPENKIAAEQALAEFSENSPVSAPSESQEEMWKKHCEQEALWDSAMQIGNSEKTYKAAIHKIMKYFSITRKPE